MALNRLILDYDRIVICGPVFPHEVVGFSGGNKYLFPGIAGPEIINFTHWLGALITQLRRHRRRLHAGPRRDRSRRGAGRRPISCFALVVTHQGVAGLVLRPLPEDAWRAAAALSARTHIVYVDKPFRRVLSVMPEMYDDLWTAAKGMYKLEPAVADGGEVVIYAPHITEVSYTHGTLIDEVGYHCRDYFMAQWDTLQHLPRGRAGALDAREGAGSLRRGDQRRDAADHGHPRDGHPAGALPAINLGYADPTSIDVETWAGREHEGVLLVRRAGEMLYRLRN